MVEGQIVLPSNSSLAALDDEGFVILDNACASTAFTDDVRHDIENLFKGGHLRESLNKVATGRAGGSNAGPDAGHVLCKKGIWERDLVYEGAVIAPEALASAPTVASFFHGGGAAALAAALAAAFPAAGVSGLCTMKVQLNTGEGGCFPFHYDTTPAVSKRALTAILYLTPDWSPEHGGQLRLLPFPFPEVDVAPLAGRLALFCSHTMPHRVMPARGAPRCCLSLWFAGGDTPFPRNFPLRTGLKPEDPLRIFLRRPGNARVLCKVLCAEAWADSITEAFGANSEVHEALSLHFNEVDDLERQIAPNTLQAIRQLMASGCAFPPRAEE